MPEGRCDWCGKEAFTEADLRELDEPDPFFLEGIVDEDDLRLCKACRDRRWDEV